MLANRCCDLNSCVLLMGFGRCCSVVWGRNLLLGFTRPIVCQNQTPDNNVMLAKPDLRAFLKWMINRSGSVILDVITLKASP